MDAHELAVGSVAEAVKSFHVQGKPFRLYHGSTNSTRKSNRRLDNTVDTSKLNNVLEIDEGAKTVLAEPNVTMEALVDATLPHGLVPLVVMEFPAITVGGGFSGTSGESSSFRYGAFDSTVNWIQIILADGTVKTASKKDNEDLFWGAASGFGTLGVVTLLEVQLKDAKPFVELRYKVTWGAREMVEVIKDECDKEENDYVDGIVYSKHKAVICVGRLVDRIPAGAIPRYLSRREDEWFYLHVERVQEDLRNGSVVCVVDYVPLRDYLFRYDRGGFWVAKYAFEYFITPFNRFTRYILDPLLRARDVGVPYEHASDFQNWLDREHGIYPLWICPLRVRRNDRNSDHGLHAEFGKPGAADLLNFGVWGPLKGNRRDIIRHNRALEQKVQEFGGKKWLYAHAYYEEAEFWSQYDKKSYDGLRAKYGASNLPNVYDKVKVQVDDDERYMASTATTGWPLKGLWGVRRAALGGDYLLQEKSDS